MTRIGSLFTGYGGLDLAAEEVWPGSEVVWHCENDPAVATILRHAFPGIPNLGDITAVDWPGVEPVDVLTGGFPCQDLSHGGRVAGMKPDTRSGLWLHMARAVRVLRPRWVAIENVRGIRSAEAHSDVEPCAWCLGDGSARHLRALGAVLGDLAVIGYDAGWVSIRASDVGAPHERLRVFILASDTGRRRGDPRVTEATGIPAEAVRDRVGPLDQPGGRGGGAAADPEPVPYEQLRIPGCVDGEEGGGGSPHRNPPRPGTVGGRRIGGGGGPAVPAEWSAEVVWGPYEPAIRRWEDLTRPAPAPIKKCLCFVWSSHPNRRLWSQALSDGDSVVFIPPVAGG